MALPSVLQCPHCNYKFKQRSFSKTKHTVCVFCGRKFPIWEARFFIVHSFGHIEDVTENIQTKLDLLKARYSTHEVKPILSVHELHQ